MLKKLFLIVMVSLLFIGCSKSDSSYSVNPPDWILGTWALSVLELEFKTDDFCYGNTDQKLCKEILKASELETDDIETKYKIKYTIPTEPESVATFTKKEGTTIGVQIDEAVELEFTKK